MNAVKHASDIFPQLNIKANTGIPQVKDCLSHIESIQNISISPDQNSIASIDKFNILKIWNSTGEIIKSFRINNGKKDTYVYFINDTSIMITPNIIFDIKSEKLIEIDGFNLYKGIPLKGKIYYYFDYTENSEAEKLFNMQTDSVLNINTVNTYTLEAATSDNKFALLGVDGLIRIRDLNGNLISTFGSDRPIVATFRGKKILLQSKISQIGFSPNGDYLISGDENGKEIIWEINK
jgi:WD40 repeat protein